jgi:hypothetical protein
MNAMEGESNTPNKNGRNITVIVRIPDRRHIDVCLIIEQPKSGLEETMEATPTAHDVANYDHMM